MNDHTITHIEIPARDFERAVAFYSKIFHWEIQVVEANSYAFFRIGNTNCGGAFNASLSPALENTGLQVVIDVDDIEKKMLEIQEEGGLIIKPKTAIPGHGYYASFMDPNNNHLQLHSNE
jgi:predicted enzyme related to lactoylglutathione lyase